MSAAPKFYFCPKDGPPIDITEPVGTDGLDLTPRVTEDTEIIVKGPGMESRPMCVKDTPWTPEEVQEIINRGGQIWP